MKNTKGITLIALVITIIVLLILAGVTISLVLNGGIITQAQNAASTTEKEQNKEKLALEVAEGKIELMSKTYDSEPDEEMREVYSCFDVVKQALRESQLMYYPDVYSVNIQNDIILALEKIGVECRSTNMDEREYYEDGVWILNIEPGYSGEIGVSLQCSIDKAGVVHGGGFSVFLNSNYGKQKSLSAAEFNKYSID